MAEVKIEIRENGPYKVTGPVQIVDHAGQEVHVAEGKTTVFLCRCGRSSDKPFCDGTHKSTGWCATLLEEASEAD